VIRRIGKSKRLFCSAARTRSRASRTSVSGSPTSVNAGKPFAKWTSTVTSGADIPDKPRLRTTASVIATGSFERAWIEHGARFYGAYAIRVPEPAAAYTVYAIAGVPSGRAYPSFWVCHRLIGRRKNDPFGLIFVRGGPRRRGTIQSRLLSICLLHRASVSGDNFSSLRRDFRHDYRAVYLGAASCACDTRTIGEA